MESSGLFVYHKTNLGVKGFEIICHYKDYILWLKLDRHCFQLDKDVLVCYVMWYQDLRQDKTY